MKKYTLIIIALIVIIGSSCHHHFGHRRSTIRITDDHNSVEIKYAGDIEFDEDDNSIANMSPNSYLQYKNNGKVIIAESDDDGNIMYEVNGEQQSSLSAYDKKAFKKAIKEILKTQGK